eukprot:TRINITY_DN1514_c0_g1_i5.p1 TRINITY_DN1514_c0_g1~~TRINITY_DN1514_c0_g1_i5.p1  ORF type:complete len:401 (-),score=81.63 TRINITY_DN1514_c0_g1_i5:1350-2552(-)
MPRELITIQVGQCGNQIGCRFWDLALREHAKHSKGGYFDDAMSTFFRNMDKPGPDASEVSLRRAPIKSLRARSVLIDMEEGVLQESLNGPLGELFDRSGILWASSGAGNNWAMGHEEYGRIYADPILEMVRHTLEPCDSPQSFFLMHSLGGGTGSGLGTLILRLLEDEFPDIYRFTVSVFPSEDDDVVTSPYNSVLAMRELVEHADCVLPVENQALIDIINRLNQPKVRTMAKSGSVVTDDPDSKKPSKPFDQMNALAAHLITNLTSSMRFEGSLNVDLNEITMNLVPFPRLHFLIPSLSPLYTFADVKMPPRRLSHMFTDAFHKDMQLIRADPRRSRYLACGLFVRGDVQVSDIHHHLGRIRSELDMIYWNEDGFKVGLCSVPPIGQVCRAHAQFRLTE